MCAKMNGREEGSPETDESDEWKRLNVRVSPDAISIANSHANKWGCSRAEAVDRMIRIASGSTDLGSEILEMRQDLDSVLEALNAPGLGAEVQDDGIAADGATAAKVDYNALSPTHTVEIDPDEREFTRSQVLKQTPRHRVPVLRGFLLQKHDGFTNGKTKTTESAVVDLAIREFGCTKATARNYVQRGHGSSWYLTPSRHLERTGWLRAMNEWRDENAHAKKHAGSLKDFFPMEVPEERLDTGANDYREARTPLIPESDKLHGSPHLHEAEANQLLSRALTAVEQRPTAAKYHLLVHRVVEYMGEFEISNNNEERVAEVFGELEGNGVEVHEAVW